MIKVIIDTNVLVSASLRGRDPEAIILFIVSSPNFEWVVSEEILLEYKSVLDRKKLKLSDEIKQKWLRIFDTFTTLGTGVV